MTSPAAPPTTIEPAEAPIREAHRVVSVRTADGAAAAPPEISERFDGRLFTLRDLEQRGVRIAGGNAWYLAGGRDWRLSLELVSRS
jgi:hypothetical protein